MILTITALTSCLKLLLIPAYKSTDFEVHRNWLAITYNLPIKQWYFEKTSEWTLDYPPLFAYFELFLSQIAYYFDKNMLDIENINYDSERTVLFQRLSVIFTDFLYSYGVYKCCKAINRGWKTSVVLPILLLTNCGLIMVDHIHFQYNGFLYGILLISIANIIQENYLWASFWFSLLLNFKHIYIYLAPAYFVFLLKNYCILDKKKFSWMNFLKKFFVLGSIVMIVFLFTFIPFYDHLGQVFTRMFPFKRGLCHAYWAPNLWAIYNTMDKFLGIFVKKYRNVASMTGGLVQEFSHTVLPNITPLVTIALTAVFMLPVLCKMMIIKKSSINFLKSVVLCALTSFLFGWHVHEKAILMAIIPLSILAVLDLKDARVFIILCITGHYSLFPLLYPPELLLIKCLLLILHSTYAFHSLAKIYPRINCNLAFPLLNIWESFYILGFILIFTYENVIHYLFKIDRYLPFLPLMLTSVYCSIGIFYCWSLFYLNFLKSIEIVKNTNKKQS